MCGFVCFVARRGQEPPTAGWLSRLSDTIVHRGPDDDGVYVDGQVGLAFRRLAILDLSPAGHQPMSSRDGAEVMVFNGEIFNYVELRSDLEALGHIFDSSGDSAVLLAAYRQWGNACVERLVGMFAFCIYDRRARKVVVARDRFGVKPLFLHRSARGLLLGSELKTIRASGLWDGRINEARFAALLAYGSADILADGSTTFLAGIEQLPSAHVLEVTLDDGDEKLFRYWSYPSHSRESIVGPVEGFRHLFEESMRIRMRADVPVGVMLSGGLDSSSIACEMARLVGPVETRAAPLHAFCYEADDFDEAEQLADTAAQTGVVVHRYRPDPVALFRELPHVLWHHDEPVHSAPALVGFGLYRMAAENGVRVVLGGQGADETAGGYGYLFDHLLVTYLSRGRWRRLASEADAVAAARGLPRSEILARVFRMARARALGGVRWYARIAAQRRLAEATGGSVLSEAGRALAATERAVVNVGSLLDALVSASSVAPLPCYLRIEDRNSMAHSIEARVPFLDHRLAEYAISLPPEWQMRDGLNKYVLREAMRGRIPESVRARRAKFGFPVPMRKWLAGPLAPMLRETVLDGPLANAGWVSMSKLERTITEHVSGSRDCSSLLFNALQLSHWLALHAAGWPRPAK